MSIGIARTRTVAKQAKQNDGDGAPIYVDADNSVMSARIALYVDLNAALDLKLDHINGIASLLISDSESYEVSAPVVALYDAIRMISSECKALSGALWERRKFEMAVQS